MQAPYSKKNILIAPLDWGLGHATRSIPIIRACIEGGHHVIIGSSGRSLQLLKQEFPGITCVEIPSYNIYYQKSGSFILKIIAQLTKVFSGIRREHRVANSIIQEHKINLIISDNRYGVYHHSVYSILISHQMMVKIPGFGLIERIVFEWLQWQHRKFREVWIPDVAGEENIAGDLAHKYRLRKNTKFIGVLTRFDPPAQIPQSKHDILVILSGPEPQRTLFEELIIEQAKNIPLRFVIVRGVSEMKSDEQIADQIRLISYLTAEELYAFILSADIIISRGGYSTLMDLALLGKKCIFIPTPGQTEQEYLVDELAKKGLVYAAAQRAFNLQSAIKEVNRVKPFLIQVDHQEFKHHLQSAINKISAVTDEL